MTGLLNWLGEPCHGVIGCAIAGDAEGANSDGLRMLGAFLCTVCAWEALIGCIRGMNPPCDASCALRYTAMMLFPSHELRIGCIDYSVFIIKPT